VKDSFAHKKGWPWHHPAVVFVQIRASRHIPTGTGPRAADVASGKDSRLEVVARLFLGFEVVTCRPAANQVLA